MNDLQTIHLQNCFQACEKKVQPGITKLTWTSTMSDAYIADCVLQIGEVSALLLNSTST